MTFEQSHTARWIPCLDLTCTTAHPKRSRTECFEFGKNLDNRTRPWTWTKQVRRVKGGVATLRVQVIF